jgi:hypothetical protein
MAWLLILALLLFLVLAAVFSPWRWPEFGRADSVDEQLRSAATELQDLESARDSKYREIRDAELDRETGKLSAEDFATVDAALRAEAVELLQQLDRAQGRLAKRRRAEGAAESVDTSWTHGETPEPVVGPHERPQGVRPEPR